MESGSYWLDKVQTSIWRDVRTLAIEEAYTTKYSIHPGADTMLCGFRVTIDGCSMKKDIASCVMLMPRVVKSRDEIFSRWGYYDNRGLSRLHNQSIERDHLIGIGFVLDFVEFISFTFGDKEMILVIEAIRIGTVLKFDFLRSTCACKWLLGIIRLFLGEDATRAIPNMGFNLVHVESVWLSLLGDGGKFTLSPLDVLQGFSFFLQMGFTLILATLDGLDVGLLGDVIGIKQKASPNPTGTQDADFILRSDETSIIVPSYPSHSIQKAESKDTSGDEVDDSPLDSDEEIFQQELARLKGQEQRATSIHRSEELQKRASTKTVPPGSIPVPTGSIPVPSGDTTILQGDVSVLWWCSSYLLAIPNDSLFDDEPQQDPQSNRPCNNEPLTWNFSLLHPNEMSLC
ncbi:hypothetical protein Tco_0008012 [Tanacetum coccineum]